jgi:TPP-dependent pyruvate/acetoin dehydrogenase alpha subunit
VRQQLRVAGVADVELEAIDQRADERVVGAVEFALASAEPDVARLAAGMHAAGSAEQFARMRPGSPFGELALTFDAGLGR